MRSWKQPPHQTSLLEEEAAIIETPIISYGYLTGWLPEKRLKSQSLNVTSIPRTENMPPSNKGPTRTPTTSVFGWDEFKRNLETSSHNQQRMKGSSESPSVGVQTKDPFFLKSMVKKAEVYANSQLLNQKSKSFGNLCFDFKERHGNLTVTPNFRLKHRNLKGTGGVGLKFLLDTATPPLRDTRVGMYLDKHSKHLSQDLDRSWKNVTTVMSPKVQKPQKGQNEGIDNIEKLTPFKVIFLEARIGDAKGREPLKQESSQAGTIKENRRWEPKLKNQQVWRLKLMRATMNGSLSRKSN